MIIKSEISKLKISVKDISEVKKVLFKFKQLKTKEEIFYNLCFALLAPQANFEGNIKANKLLIENDFYYKDLSYDKLTSITKFVRFKNRKAFYLLEMKKKYDELYMHIQSIQEDIDKRKYLVENICGLGMKVASHFLRNLGYDDLAIIDVHVLRFMGFHIPKNKKEYLMQELEFRKLAKKYGFTIGELDALLWKDRANIEWKEFIY